MRNRSSRVKIPAWPRDEFAFRAALSDDPGPVFECDT